MAVNIGPRIGIDGESEYRKQIQNIIQQTKTLKSEYDALSSTFKKGTTTLKSNAAQHEYLTKQIKLQEQRVKENNSVLEQAQARQKQLNDEIMSATVLYGEDSKEVKALEAQLGKAENATEVWKQKTNEATAELNRMRQELQDLPNSIELIGTKMESAGGKIKNLGSGITNIGNSLKPISTAAAGVIGGATKVFMDFEHQMSRVKAISGATGEDFEKLNSVAREMGATTKFTATEAGQAFEYMAMAGWKSGQMIEGIAPIMDLAAASGEDLANVSDIVTDALTAFGLKAEDAGRFADVLAAASTNANTNVAMMGESFKYAAPVAGSLGYSIEDVALALGLMANSGIKADMAGTSLRNMLNRMAKPTKESSAAMDRLGLSLQDANGDMYSLRDIMEQMRSSFDNIKMPIDEFNRQVENLTQALDDGEITEKEYEKELEELANQAYGAEGAEKARAAAMLGGTRAMSAMLAIANASEEDYQKLTEAIDGSAGAAHNMAEIMESDTTGAWTKARGALESAGITLGETFAPYVAKAAEAVKELCAKFQELDPETQEMIAKGLAAAAVAAPLTIAIGKMTTGVGSLVSAGGGALKFLGSLSGGFATATGSASTLTGGLGTLAGAGGIGAIAAPAAIAVGAVTVLAGAFVTAYKEDEAFASEVNKSWAEIKQAIKGVIDTIAPAWKAFSNALSPVFVSAMNTIKNSINNFRQVLQGFIDFFGGIFSGNWNRVLNGMANIAFGVINNIISRFQGMKSAIEGIFARLNIQLPHIKLPHFSVESTDSFGLPKIKIDWYAKAMQNGMRLSQATIFGAAGGRLLGGGEVGKEWVVGENSLMGMIRSAVNASAGAKGPVNIGDTTIVINALPGQDVNELAEAVDEIINQRLRQVEAAWA